MTCCPTDVAFGESLEFEDRERAFDLVLKALPLIDGWKPDISIPSPHDVEQWRFDPDMVAKHYGRFLPRADGVRERESRTDRECSI